jgi:hypothetical protein
MAFRRAQPRGKDLVSSCREIRLETMGGSFAAGASLTS